MIGYQTHLLQRAYGVPLRELDPGLRGEPLDIDLLGPVGVLARGKGVAQLREMGYVLLRGDGVA